METKTLSQKFWNYASVFLILFWIPVSYFVLILFFPQPIEFFDHEKRELVQNIMRVVMGLLVLGNFFSAFRCFKISGRAKYLVGLIWLITLPLQYIWWIAFNMGLFGK